MHLSTIDPITEIRERRQREAAEKQTAKQNAIGKLRANAHGKLNLSAGDIESLLPIAQISFDDYAKELSAIIRDKELPDQLQQARAAESGAAVIPDQLWSAHLQACRDAEKLVIDSKRKWTDSIEALKAAQKRSTELQQQADAQANRAKLF